MPALFADSRRALRRARASARAAPAPPDEVWPADDTPNYPVGAPRRPHTPATAPARISLADRARLARARSRQSLADDPRMRRVASHHADDRPAQGGSAQRRSITALEDDWLRRGAGGAGGGAGGGAAGGGEGVANAPPRKAAAFVMQGYCRMAWFAGLRCTRFLRLARRQLECFDGALRKRLWAVVLDGARVRIHMNTHKIVLSKLQCGYLIEFYVADDRCCKEWAAALLRASTLAQTPHDDF